MKFFRKAFDAIKNFEKYEDFALEETRIALSYFTKLILLFVVVISILFTYRFYIIANQMIGYVKTEIPDVTFEDGKLQIASEQPIIIENEEAIVPILIMDTNSEEQLEEYRDKVDLFGNGIILLNDRMIIRNDRLSNEMVYYYATIAQNYGIPNFDKPMLETYLMNLNQISTYLGVLVIIVIYMFLVYFLSGLVDGIMLGILAWILARIANIQMKFRNGFHIGIYALTLPILLNMIYIVVNQLTGFNITNFQWMYSIISYIYVFIAILMIRTDLMNRQMQLIKLQEEQKKVREELEQERGQEPEERENDNQKKKEKNEPIDGKKEEEQPDGMEA